MSVNPLFLSLAEESGSVELLRTFTENGDYSSDLRRAKT